MTKDAVAFRWSDLEVDRPMDLLSRRRIIGEKMMLSHIHLDAGCDVPAHRHENEQFACVLSGKIRFRLGDDGGHDETLVGGEVLWLPSGVLHSAQAIEDTVVLDVFSPPSETTGIDRD